MNTTESCLLHICDYFHYFSSSKFISGTLRTIPILAKQPAFEGGALRSREKSEAARAVHTIWLWSDDKFVIWEGFTVASPPKPMLVVNLTHGDRFLFNSRGIIMKLQRKKLLFPILIMTLNLIGIMSKRQTCCFQKDTFLISMCEYLRGKMTMSW